MPFIISALLVLSIFFLLLLNQKYPNSKYKAFLLLPAMWLSLKATKSICQGYINLTCSYDLSSSSFSQFSVSCKLAYEASHLILCPCKPNSALRLTISLIYPTDVSAPLKNSSRERVISPALPEVPWLPGHPLLIPYWHWAPGVVHSLPCQAH